MSTLLFKHPSLFKLLMSIVFVNFVIGVGLIFGDPLQLISFNELPEQGIIPPLSFWGTVFIINGLLIMAGSFSKYYRLVRYGLIASAAIGGFWAFGFTTNYLTGDIRGISAPVLWTFYTFIAMIASSEPTANPLSATLQNDIHTTLQLRKHRDHVLNKDHPSSTPTTESKQKEKGNES